MRLDQSAFAFRGNVTVMTPSEWVMPPDERGPFRFRFEIRPPTPGFKRHLARRLAKRDTAEAVAARQLGGKAGMKAATKRNQRLFSRTPAAVRAQEQEAYNEVRSELVENAWQVFEDGAEEVLSQEDLVVAFTIPAEDSDRWAHVQNAAAGYSVEDFADEEDAEALLRRLDLNGEALAHALARFVQHHSTRADAQLAEQIEKEIAGPLASTPGSSPGSRPVAVTTTSEGAGAGSASSGAGRAGGSGSLADVVPAARATTG